ncbi:uncharacterized protein BHQ10_003933 [Talaromyces amestolkiae]|uniref:Integrase catalytic domain-containing protein n=1 Tax=Talaromyces amestolkiae TaxID=1196081 RepID=A0A364KWQ1_TALAM|nr:uncharacterized protein BHQ10_003933 [Talaromyces amestolkiae]RAO67921.1 hypothetical protein BHQ10_003933 [Talaromyces amestolkiae]
MDFVIGLPKSKNNYDALIVIVEKFTKAVKLIPGTTKYTAIDWAKAYFRHVYPSWGLPQVIISDRDAKFTSDFWSYLFRRASVRLGITAAYHPAADGQTERINAIIETMLRCLLFQLPDDTIWDELLPDVEHFLFTSKSETTGKTPFELLYGVEARSEFIPQGDFRFDSADDFIKERERIRAEAADATQYAQSRMAFYFDQKHKPVEMKNKVYIRLTRKPGHNGYKADGSTVFSPLKIGPFPIKRRIGNLAYELELPPDLSIHPVISVIHLEQAPEDEWDRPVTTTIPEEVHQIRLPFEIDQVIDKKPRPIQQGSKRKIWYYLVKYKTTNQTTWQPAAIVSTQCPALVAEFEDKTSPPTQRTTPQRPDDQSNQDQP